MKNFIEAGEFSSFLSLPLSAGPDCFRALRTATRQNNWMEKKRRNFREKNNALKVDNINVGMQQKQEQSEII
ncbi:hypothetical protein QQF64_017994 [Cirrhinus molitorella]|uniref:Uncharacterized protein n=1 Tax=Cirrhinus molitorella TaxID=172907 RepID=A0ABR3LMR2_9TELE